MLEVCVILPLVTNVGIWTERLTEEGSTPVACVGILEIVV